MPYTQQPLPIISTPPMREWSSLNLAYSTDVTELRQINMPNLQNLNCDGIPLSTLPWADLQSLVYLGVYGCSFVTLEVWRLPNLQAIFASDIAPLQVFDAHDHPNLSNIDLNYCHSLTTIDVSGCPNVQSIYAYDCGFDTPLVDQLLADLVANGTSDGYVDVSGISNSPPSNPDGLAYRTILISRGWTVYTK